MSMKTYFRNAQILTPHELISGSTLVIESGKVQGFVAKDEPLPPGAAEVDAAGRFLAPGLIDVHFHGALGKDTMDADPQAILALAKYCLAHGVTGFYPTTWSASPDDIFTAIEAVRQAQILGAPTLGTPILGVHVEGPYIDLKFRGAQSPSNIRPPDRYEYERWLASGVVKLVTCAPEIEGSFEFIQTAVAQGVQVSIGHTQASWAEVVRAADLGASQATHVFNGMLGLHHRQPGTVGAVLTDRRIYAQMICDGVHLHEAIVKLVVNAKTPARTILITDAIRGAGLPDGDYDHKGQKFSVVQNIARTPEGGLSGSTLSLDQAVRNALRFTGRPITEVLPMATSVPADAMGLTGHKGVIQPGADADLILFNPDFQVAATWVGGVQRYSNGSPI